jgi:hypothetical protein
LLPNAKLKPAYDKAVWMYVYRDFSGSAADKAAERVALRFGLTSWPQHLLVDPATLEVVGDTGRTVESFLAAVNAAKAGKGDAALEAWRKAEARANELEAKPARAETMLGDADIVVRTMALRLVVKASPAKVAARAAELLAVPSDPFRYEVCDALVAQPDPAAVPALEAVLAGPKDSRNPNVLRIKAAAALGACGGEGSIAALAPFAKGGANNGLTGTCVDAIAAIAARSPGAEPSAKAALVEAYPEPAAEASLEKATVALAKRVHGALEKVTGRKAEFPAKYDAAAREALRKGW